MPIPLLILILAPRLALAAPEAEPGVPSGTFIQAMLGLALIIGLLFLFAFLARKFLGGKGFGQGGLRLLGGIALGPRERIVLVEAGDQWLVVGIVPGQIRTLHRMPKSDMPEAGSGLFPSDPPFAQWMRQIMERRDHGK